MDSQDVILWGRPQPDKYLSKQARIKALCDWGRPFGLNGFVRTQLHLCVHAIADCTAWVLNDDSEVMKCDFLDAMEVVTFLYLLPPRLPGFPQHTEFPFPSDPSLPSPPVGWRGSLPSERRSMLEAYLAGSWHDHAPGETRVCLHYSGLVTY